MDVLCKVCGGPHLSGACTEVEKLGALKLQYLPMFEPFQGGKVDEKGKYAEPSPERKAEIERRLDQLGDIMDGAIFNYNLDGAINISFLQGKFFRDHKDIDISVADVDLQALDEQLKKKGYVIVYSDRSKNRDNQRCLEVVSAQEVLGRKLGELQLARVDEEGKIKDDHVDLNFVDLHIPHREDNGDMVVGSRDVKLPAKYFEKIKTYHTKGGHEIPISHPLVIAYHKVEQGRDYDFEDLKHLRDYLSEEDREFLIDIFKREPERRFQWALPKIKEMFVSINPSMRSDEIISQLEKSGIGQYPEGRAFIDGFPEVLKAEPDMTEEKFISMFIERFRLKEKLETAAEEKIDKIKQALGF